MEAEKRRTPTHLDPVMEASSVQGAQLSRCSSLLPLHSREDGSRASFRNFVILIFNILLFGRWIKSINPSPHNIIHRRQNLLELYLYFTLPSTRNQPIVKPRTVHN